MCQVCKYIIFRLQQEFDLAMSQLERDKVDTLNSLLADAHIALWQQKEGIAYQPTIDEALDQALGVIVAGPGGKSPREKFDLTDYGPELDEEDYMTEEEVKAYRERQKNPGDFDDIQPWPL